MRGATMKMIYVCVFLRLPTLVTRDSVREETTATTQNKLHE